MLSVYTVFSFVAAALCAFGKFASREPDNYRDEDPVWYGLRGQKEVRERLGNEGARNLVRRRSLQLRNAAGLVCVCFAILALFDVFL